MAVSINFAIIVCMFIWAVLLFLSFRTRMRALILFLGVYTLALGVIAWGILPVVASLNVIIATFMLCLGIIFLAYALKF